jgi:hypothetical protein
VTLVETGNSYLSFVTGSYILSTENNQKGSAVQHQNAPKVTFAG